MAELVSDLLAQQIADIISNQRKAKTPKTAQVMLAIGWITILLAAVGFVILVHLTGKVI